MTKIELPTQAQLAQMYPTPPTILFDETQLREYLRHTFKRFTSFDMQQTNGSWGVQEIKKFSFLVAPLEVERYAVYSTYNLYEGKMSPETFGAAITLYVFNRRLWKFHDEGHDVQRLSGRYYSMLSTAHASKNLDGLAIMNFLD